MTRRFWGITLVALALTTGLGLALARDQGASGPAAARAAAQKAWNTGAFDELERLTAPHPTDETLVVLRARGASAVGDFPRAESLLHPLAAKSPGGEAALELGLLQSYQGRRQEARRTLQLVMLAGQDAEYLVKATKAYRTTRKNWGMQRYVAGLSDKDIENVVAYYAAQVPGAAEAPPSSA